MTFQVRVHLSSTSHPSLILILLHLHHHHQRQLHRLLPLIVNMTEQSSSGSRPESPAVPPPTRVVSGSLRDRIAKFSNADAVPLVPNNPYGGGGSGGASSGPSHARGGLVGNRLPGLDPKTAGITSLGAANLRRVSERRDLIGNRIPSGTGNAATSNMQSQTTGGSVTAVPTTPTSTTSAAGASAAAAAAAAAAVAAPAPPIPTTATTTTTTTATRSVRSASPAGSAASSSAAASSSRVSGTQESGSTATSLSSSPDASPGSDLPPQLLVSTLPDQLDAGAMTPSSTIAEAGEETNERSMPTTPVATATDLPPPGYDLVPGNLTLNASGASYAPSLSSSLASQYDPASIAEEETNMKDVSGVSTPTGTPRQAHRDLDDRSIAGSARGMEELDDKIDELAIEEEKEEHGNESTPEPSSSTPAVKKQATSKEEPIKIDDEEEDVTAATPTDPASPIETNKDTDAAPETSPVQDATTTSHTAPAPVAAAAAAGAGAGIAAVAGVAGIAAAKAVEEPKEELEEEPKPEVTKPAAEEPTADTTKAIPKEGDTSTLAPAAAGEESAVPEMDREATPTREVVPEEVPPKEPSAAPELAVAVAAAAPAEVLAEPAHTEDDQDADELHRRSQDTLRAYNVKVMTSPETSHDSLRPTLEGGDFPDREATPQPQPAQLARDDGPVVDLEDPPVAPALDDNSDIVSIHGASLSVRSGGGTPSTPSTPLDDDMVSNHSSLPPARASSELEFRYEDYHDQFFRDQSGHPSAAAALMGHSRSQSGGRSLASTSEHPVGGVNGNDETMFPDVPTSDVSPHKPMQVHVEPSPFGPISSDTSKRSTSPPKAPPAELAVPSNGPKLTVEAPSPSAAQFEDAPSSAAPDVDFPAAPSNELPDAVTPADSRPTSPSASTAAATTRTRAPSFPVVPDEEHPYVSVHTSPHHASTSSSGVGGVSFPRGSESPVRRTSRSSLSSMGRPPDTAPRTPPMDSPSLTVEEHEHRLSVEDADRHSVDSHGGLSSTDSHEQLSVDGPGGTPLGPRKKRNSFTPRSPLLDDEDPGDFEPGEGFVVSETGWKAYERASPLPRWKLPTKLQKQG